MVQLKFRGVTKDFPICILGKLMSTIQYRTDCSKPERNQEILLRYFSLNKTGEMTNHAVSHANSYPLTQRSLSVYNVLMSKWAV